MRCDAAVSITPAGYACFNPRTYMRCDYRTGEVKRRAGEFQSTHLHEVRRIAGERKWILGRSSHADIIELMDAIGKQATAWKNSLIALDSRRNND